MSGSQCKSDVGGIRSQIKGAGGNKTLFLNEALVEARRAQTLFPSSEGLIAALMEEVGELACAILEKPWPEVRKEAIQVAAMACRLATEGDPTVEAVRSRRVKRV